jgi:hypothetical protein
MFESEEGQDLEAGRPLAIKDWVTALRCVIESARLRRGSAPGTRYDLDFLGPFIAEAARR